MILAQLTIPGDTPSKKNSKRRIQRGTHLFMVPSLNHERWHKSASESILRPQVTFEGPLLVLITIYSKTARAGDCTNKAESVMDFLVDMGYITDDNWNVMPLLIPFYGGKDAKNPRAEVTIVQPTQMHTTVDKIFRAALE